VKTEKDIWELVRQKIDMDSDSSKEDSVEEINKKDNLETIKDYQFEINRTEEKQIPSISKTDFNTTNLFSDGIFAGFVYIFIIMIVLGILTIPGSITAAVGGFFGGRKAGDPARALTAAMLPFLVIATAYLLASSGALPPGSGPNDIADKIGEMLGHNPDKSALGPISKMPDSNSSVFISVVTFAFIGGLVNIESKSKKKLTN
jgi:ABC-type dipeptide/oligopeptide/nickel transport system permease subunit